MTATASILRQFSRKDGEPLRILTAPTHEAYETNLAKTNAIFYAYSHKHFKIWNEKYRPLPDNYRLLKDGPHGQFPLGVNFDLVLSQNKFGQFQVLSDIAQKLQLPLISLEHTLPIKQWHPSQIELCRQMQGDINVFISAFSQRAWGFANADVIHHGIDTEQFIPYTDDELTFFGKSTNILSVVNDWINRDHCCNFQGWQRITKGLNTRVIGDTPGLSSPASSLKELISIYKHHRIFLNTSTVSPVPTALLEAMSCGCAVVTTATCMIPEVIENGVNGFISNDENELRGYCELLLKDSGLAYKLGQAARQTIEQKFSQKSFVDNWNTLFTKAANIVK